MVSPRICELRRILLPRTLVNRGRATLSRLRG
jgi:hypothetical protein